MGDFGSFFIGCNFVCEIIEFGFNFLFFYALTKQMTYFPSCVDMYGIHNELG